MGKTLLRKWSGKQSRFWGRERGKQVSRDKAEGCRNTAEEKRYREQRLMEEDETNHREVQRQSGADMKGSRDRRQQRQRGAETE